MVKDCKSCIHSRVCKLKDKYEQYQNEMLGLITKWGKDNPFGFTTDCPEYHADITRDTKPKSDLDIWIEHERNIASKREPRITYEINYDNIPKGALDGGKMPSQTCEDEITTTTIEDKETSGLFTPQLTDNDKEMYRELLSYIFK